MRRTEIRDLRNPVGTPWVFSDVANKGLRTLIFSCGRDKDLLFVQGASDGIDRPSGVALHREGRGSGGKSGTSSSVRSTGRRTGFSMVVKSSLVRMGLET